jgi:lipopolysaccharide transport system ATP-binding protein
MSAIIRVEGLSKQYRIGQRQAHDTLRDQLMHWISRPWSRAPAPSAQDEFWALRDVSFEVRQGERLGIIGRNGAGKSTLLKILSRITEPSAGRVALGGRVASLLEVGTGFHPELSGRENIYLNGAVLGMRRAEIARKFDAIVDFAEIDNFLDTPVKRYSSGMYVRLAFAVAAHLEPEILVIDEVLAVGDVRFQKKCLGKMREIGQSGRTVLFVSHNMQAIRQLCERAILLDGGRALADGPSAQVVERYLDGARPGGECTPQSLERMVRALPADPDCRVLGVSVLQDGTFCTRPGNGRPVEVMVEYQILREVYGFHLFLRLHDAEGNILFESTDCGEDEQLPNVQPGFYRSVAAIPADLLAPRRYELALGAAIVGGRHCLPEPIRIPIDVEPGGRVNRQFPGYVAPGVLLPSIPWRSSILEAAPPR